MSRIIKRAQQRAKGLLATGKAKAVVIVGAVGTVSAQAAWVVPEIDTLKFLDIAGAVILATGVFFAVRKALSLLR